MAKKYDKCERVFERHEAMRRMRSNLHIIEILRSEERENGAETISGR